jgi:dipeptidase E
VLSSRPGRPADQHCRDAIAEFLGPVARRVALVTAASLRDEGGYCEAARSALGVEPARLDVAHLRWDGDFGPTLARAEAIFVDGGNTYALLDRLRRSGLLAAIGDRVRAGVPYIGSSAGSNLAGPNIQPTND